MDNLLIIIFRGINYSARFMKAPSQPTNHCTGPMRLICCTTFFELDNGAVCICCDPIAADKLPILPLYECPSSGETTFKRRDRTYIKPIKLTTRGRTPSSCICFTVQSVVQLHQIMKCNRINCIFPVRCDLVVDARRWWNVEGTGK